MHDGPCHPDNHIKQQAVDTWWKHPLSSFPYNPSARKTHGCPTTYSARRRCSSEVGQHKLAVSETTTLAPIPQPSEIAQLSRNTSSTSTSPRTHKEEAAVTTVIPPIHPFRTLVLCFDGTGDQFDSDNSNIVELFSILKKDDPNLQMVYYQAGIGTYTIPQIATPFMATLSKTLDEMIAWNLMLISWKIFINSHIGGYEFLMQNYRAGDRICIFGFSRGAYTARCLAGMIHKVGLLPSGNHQQVPFAYKMYTNADEEGWEQSNAFKHAFAMDVDIELLGLGHSKLCWAYSRRLPFASSNTIIKTFRHAVSLDERRAKFKANLWNRPDDQEQCSVFLIKDCCPSKGKDAKAVEGTNLEEQYGKDRSTPTDVVEVWFSGCHCDVGGGSVRNGTRPNLARIPLRWMIRECFKTKSGIIFETNGLRRLGLDPSCLYPDVLPRSPALPSGGITQPIPPKEQSKAEIAAAAEAEMQETEEQLDLKDSMSPVYDQLSLHWFWWILELLPMWHRWQLSNDSWIYRLGSTLATGGRLRDKRKKELRYTGVFRGGWRRDILTGRSITRKRT
ncbi:hypothetical protein BDQ17DRAFT_1429684 [Cyathus striatus]|nr:hypothetical protein BDQ17DRAFT_1429684 [Cyathus striatus]